MSVPTYLLYRKALVCRVGPGVLGGTETLRKPFWTEGNRLRFLLAGGELRRTGAPRSKEAA